MLALDFTIFKHQLKYNRRARVLVCLSTIVLCCDWPIRMFTNKNVSGPRQSSVSVVELINRCLDERCTCSVHVHVRSGDSTTSLPLFVDLRYVKSQNLY